MIMYREEISLLEIYKSTLNFLREKYHISDKIIDVIVKAEKQVYKQYMKIQKITQYNQQKVLYAFQKERIEVRHFNPTTGYGYDDAGRDALDRVFSSVFNSESALVRPQFVSGTHALSACLFALLRPGDHLVSLSGQPYDTLEEVIGSQKNSKYGSLADFHISYSQVELKSDGTMDMEHWERHLSEHQNTKLVLLQRSRGYSWRPSFDIATLKIAIQKIQHINDTIIIMIDNCYGEFTEIMEPTDIGADLIVGSLIKNPGGGMAPTGAYVAGRSDLIDLVGYRITSPGIGREVGSYAGGYLPFYQGLFMAPHIVGESLKGSILASRVFEELGFDVIPSSEETRSDIIVSIKFMKPELLIAFCQGVQKAAPIDSFVTPQPWAMPGYQYDIIMAAGTFIQGASIELSADAPIRPPYVGYLQGGLTYEHCKIALMIVLQEMKNKGYVEV